MLEVVIVMALLSFFTITVATYYRPNDTDLISQTHILKTHIRYAQARAMNTNTTWGIRYDREGDQRRYWLFQDTAREIKIALPGQTNDSVNLSGMGLSITGTEFDLVFDNWGRPSVTERSFTEGQITLNLNRSGTNGDDIIITENTGFIP